MAKLKYLTMETREKHWFVPGGDSEQAPLCGLRLQMHTCKWCLPIHEYWMDSCAPREQNLMLDLMQKDPLVNCFRFGLTSLLLSWGESLLCVSLPRVSPRFIFNA